MPLPTPGDDCMQMVEYVEMAPGDIVPGAVQEPLQPEPKSKPLPTHLHPWWHAANQRKKAAKSLSGGVPLSQAKLREIEADCKAESLTPEGYNLQRLQYDKWVNERRHTFVEAETVQPAKPLDSRS